MTRRAHRASPRRGHRGERGMAMLLVLLMIVMVSAAGIYAAHSAALDIRSSGFIRQAGQTHYVSEAGIIAPMEELRRYCSAYLRVMRTDAAGVATPTGLAEPPVQHRFYLDDFASRTLTSGIFAAASTSAGTTSEGSLGVTRLTPLFVTTAQVLSQSSQPTFGWDYSGGNSFRPQMMAVEFSADGTTKINGVTGAWNNTVGNESARVIALLPCL